jgi:signal transduction histidine kinase/CheY-like chemotaxis protein
MKRIYVIVFTIVLIIIVANYFYYKNLYNSQINYIVELLDRQVQLVGLSIDSTNNECLSDLHQIGSSEDISGFFSDPGDELRAKEKMKLFFSKYQRFVTGIKLCDNNRNEFTLKKDVDSGDWLEQKFVLHIQARIYDMEKLILENGKFEYYLPIYDKTNSEITGNLTVTVDYQKSFSEIFSVFHLKDYQWQWVVTDSGRVIYNNIENKIEYTQLKEISKGLGEGSIGNIIHKAAIDGKERYLVSSYYSTQLLQRELLIVFSSPTDLFQKFIIKNSLFVVLGTLFLIMLIVLVFWRKIKSQKSEMERLNASEKTLFRLIEEMPVGVIIHNSYREIIKANKVAAQQYSYDDESEMTGKIFPETSNLGDSNYFSGEMGGNFNPDKIVVIKKEIGETVLYRNSIPISLLGEEANMEILIDVTMLESARKQEAKANVAKSEFLTRMSYEIRTPLNGIIGMMDILNKYDLSQEVREILSLLNRSTEVLLSIINDILDFSRIEAGRMILDEVPFNLRAEIDYCVVLAKTYITGKDLKLICSIDEKVPESIIGDPFRLRQVLINLLNHSVKNTDKGEIRLDCSLKSSKSEIITLCFSLLDTGTSFDKASLKKIFGDFVNIESKAVTKDESGFGTILSKQLIKLMGGELTADSPSGISGDMGTKVVFTILAYSNDRLIKKLSHIRLNSFEKIKTLVITGNQSRDEEILGVLHKLGLNVSITTFLKSTINQISSNMNNPATRYNLVVIFDDKDFDGFDVANVIWENRLSSSFIILMISSNDKKGNYKKCITMGIDHYIVKPFDLNELLSTLKSSFPYIGDTSAVVEIDSVRSDIKILIVEDNKMNQKVIGTMLKSLGYSFDIVDDGYAGYVQAQKKKFDLIFMDLLMPEMDGFESAQKILEHDKSVLIVAFTADNMPESRRKAERAGIRDFISKPVRIEDLKNLFAKYFIK